MAGKINFLYSEKATKFCEISTMAIRAVEISNGSTKLERFLPRNQCTQRKLLNF